MCYIRREFKRRTSFECMFINVSTFQSVELVFMNNLVQIVLQFFISSKSFCLSEVSTFSEVPFCQKLQLIQEFSEASYHKISFPRLNLKGSDHDFGAVQIWKSSFQFIVHSNGDFISVFLQKEPFIYYSLRTFISLTSIKTCLVSTTFLFISITLTSMLEKFFEKLWYSRM